MLDFIRSCRVGRCPSYTKRPWQRAIRIGEIPIRIHEVKRSGPLRIELDNLVEPSQPILVNQQDDPVLAGVESAEARGV